MQQMLSALMGLAECPGWFFVAIGDGAILQSGESSDS